MFLRTKSNGQHTYLQLVESHRSGTRVRQRVLTTLGRLDRLQDSGALDRLLLSVSRFCQHAAVLAARDRSLADGFPARVLGPALVFEPLWRQTGCRAALRAALAARRFQFDVERAVFLAVLHRLIEPGSDRQAVRWMSDQAVDGADTLELQHFYRAMAWLGEACAEAPGQARPAAAAERAPRYVKDELEEDLFARRRDLFTGLDLVFFDTTSHYFHGAGGTQLGQRGKSKDGRPQCPQVVVGAVLDSAGRPVCSELWPGNTADVTTLLPVAQRLRERFGIGQVCLVADRGMIARATMQALEEQGWGYLLGVRMRSTKEFGERVLEAEGEELRIAVERAWQREPLELGVREVIVQEPGQSGPGARRRYVLCRNAEQARRDRAVREQIVEQLRGKLGGGAKELVGNRGYRRYLRARGQGFDLDEDKIAAEERYDGLWALRVQADLSAEEAVRKYKELWRVERCFREAKSLLRTRPVYHRTNEAIRGHIFCSFLALVLKQELEARMREAGIEAEWADVVRDLGRLSETVVELQGKRFAVRTQAQGAVPRIVRCVGASLPNVVRRCDASAGPPAPELQRDASEAP